MLTAWASNIVFLIHSEAIQAEISDHNQRDSLMGGNSSLRLSLKSHVTYFYAVPADDVKSLFSKYLGSNTLSIRNYG